MCKYCDLRFDDRLQAPSQRAVVLGELPTAAVPPSRETTALLQAVLDRGILRVGFIDGSMPGLAPK